LTFGLDDLVRCFGVPAVECARTHVERGEVDAMPVGPEATRLFGIIRSWSRNRPPVRVSARVDSRPGGSVALSGDCSCRAYGNCEHVAAVLLLALGDAALEDAAWEAAVRGGGRRVARTPRTKPPRRIAAPRSWGADHQADSEARAVRAWLADVLSVVRSDSDSDSDRRERSKYRLLYLLDGEPRMRRLTVHPVVVYVRKDGGYGAVKNCGFTGGRPRPSYAGVADRELLAVILAHAAGSWGATDFHSPVEIDAEVGSSLLERLLATGRCHWQDPHGAALRAGEPRSASIEWKLEPEGIQRPGIVVEGCPEAVGIVVEPPWYVDPGAGIAGPLDLNVELRAAASLLRAPDLSPESAGLVREALRSASADGRPPLPAPLPVGVEQRAPVPVCHLRFHFHCPEPDPSDWARTDPPGIPLAKLTFDYDGASVFPEDDREIIQQVVGGDLIRTRRNGTLEKEAVDRLEAMGFVDLVEVPLPRAYESNDRLAGGFLPDPGDGDIASFLIAFARDAVPLLRTAGWIVEFDEDYPFRVIEGEPQWYAEVSEAAEEANPWFDLELGVEIDGERHSLLPILVGMLRNPAFDLAAWETAEPQNSAAFALRTHDGRVLVLPAERVRAIVGTLTELFGERPLSEEGALSLSSVNAPRLDELDEALGEGTLAWSGGEETRKLGRKLRGFRRMKKVAVPRAFRGKLRPYQRDGLNWLQFLREHELAGVLADDMGLGKTVQVLAHLLVEKRAGRAERPSLVVAPTSVIANWRNEAERFTPDLRVLVLQGTSRKARFDRLADHDLVLTTYPLLSRDENVLTAQPYHALILDEAQFVKNAKTKASLVARRIEARHRLCLTGTPMENHLGELWSLFHILMPGLLGDTRHFRKLFRTPIEKHGDRSRREQLAARVRPFLLRRTKDEIESELPPKTEMVRSIELGRSQRDLYESVRLAMNEKVRKEVARKGLERSTIVILDALLKLRQACCDARLLKIKEAKRVKESAKLGALMEMLDEMLEEGRCILLFSQFTSMLRLIEQELVKRKISWVTITGNTRDRERPVRRFQAGEVPLFLISLKAGGTGLNLTAADTVIHYDPWWNPAVEDQATDRAHRIGQDKPVFVYRLIVSGSVEEKMLALQSRKRDLAEGIYGAGRLKGGAPLSAEDLQVLFQPLEEVGLRSDVRPSASRARSAARPVQSTSPSGP
jgi:superfamily II DNA or RNA helicase